MRVSTVPADFKRIRGYILSEYPVGKQAGNGRIYFLRVRYYPYPTRPVVIPRYKR